MTKEALVGLILSTVGIQAAQLFGLERTEENRRKETTSVEVAKGEILSIFARRTAPGEEESSTVNVTLSNEDEDVIWSACFGTVNFAPRRTGYYALVQIREESVFMFSTWNDYYCTFDRKSGKVIKDGKGDQILRRFRQLTPLKLILIHGRSTGYAVD